MRVDRLLAMATMAVIFFAPNLARAWDPVEACKALTKQNQSKYFELPDAPTAVHTARVIPAGGDGTIVEKDLPEICRVEGQIAANVGFLLRMPTKTWNGKFMMGGCGGPCGNYLTDRIDAALVRNYAVVVTDMGHRGNGWIFGLNNVQGQIDFGYRATHVTAVAAKEIIADYYGKRAARNYFWGCSTGGRQALIEAQRFPLDFEGIAGGSPPQTQTMHQPLIAEWGQRNNFTKDGKQILSPDKLPMIHKAVLEACDALDNLKDGVIQNPQACKWDPGAIACKNGKAGADCLTAAEVEVVRKIYNGATWSNGKPMYYGNSGLSRGSELKWKGELGAQRNGDSQEKFFGVFGARGPGFDDRTFDIDKDVPRLALTEIFFEHRNPDLRTFKEAGGKFIFYNGWDDTCCRAMASIDYYEMVTRVMGGEQKTKEFMRLFLPSGMDHCRFGIGGGEVDWITPLETWVEKGQAPEEVIAYHMVKEPYPSIERPVNDVAERLMLMARHPLPAGSYDRAHPVYPYPDWPRYSGTGDPNLPSSWEKAPRPPS